MISGACSAPGGNRTLLNGESSKDIDLEPAEPLGLHADDVAEYTIAYNYNYVVVDWHWANLPTYDLTRDPFSSLWSFLTPKEGATIIAL